VPNYQRHSGRNKFGKGFWQFNLFEGYTFSSWKIHGFGEVIQKRKTETICRKKFQKDLLGEAHRPLPQLVKALKL